MNFFFFFFDETKAIKECKKKKKNDFMLIKLMQVHIMLKFWILFNSELKLKNTESAIKNKLNDLLSELQGSKFVTTLVIEIEK